MKKIITLIAAAVMLVISCQKENIEFEKSTTSKLTATFANSDASGKTRVSYTETAEQKLQPAWEVGDDIIGFDDAGNTYTFTVTEVKSTTATLSADKAIADGTYHLIYKSGAQAGDISSSSLAIDYTVQAGDKTMPAVMLADGTVTDGACNFAFTNAGAIIGISAVKGVPSGTAISKITIEGSNLSAATVSLDGSALALNAKTAATDAISTSTLNGITVTDENGTLSSPVFIAVPAGAVISRVLVDNYSYTLGSPKTVGAGQYLYVKSQEFNRYKYTVRYLSWEEYLKGKETPVADDETRYVTTLPITVTEPAKTGNDLNKRYRANYQPVPGNESVTATITEDGQKIYIFYQKKSSSS